MSARRAGPERWESTSEPGTAAKWPSRRSGHSGPNTEPQVHGAATAEGRDGAVPGGRATGKPPGGA